MPGGWGRLRGRGASRGRGRGRGVSKGGKGSRQRQPVPSNLSLGSGLSSSIPLGNRVRRSSLVLAPEKLSLGDDCKEVILSLMGELELQRMMEEEEATRGTVREDDDDDEEEDDDDEDDDDYEEEEEDGEEVEELLEEVSAMMVGQESKKPGRVEQEGDFEYSSCFADMANLLSRGELHGEEEEDDDDDDDDQEEEEEEEGGGAATRHQKQQKTITKKEKARMLDTLIKQDREESVAAKLQQQEEAIKKIAQGGGPSVAAQARGNNPVRKNVRLLICRADQPKGKRVLVVVDRKKDIEGLLKVAKTKLGIKKPMDAFLPDTGLPLDNTLLVQDDALVWICDKPLPSTITDDKASKKGKKDEEPSPAPTTTPLPPPPPIPPKKDPMEAMRAAREAYQRRAKDSRDAMMDKRTGDDKTMESARIRESFEALQQQPEYQRMLQQRATLPAYGLKDNIIEVIESAQVTIVEGETGSGKTTQVPQFVLDKWILDGRGADCNILCTQPRRISAVGVADRISAERCETVGGTVGYAIRLEHRRSSRTKLLFYTTGVLLRRLQSDPDLQGVSHVFVDEVHERDLHTDFLLIILKDLLARRHDLKLILMSATLQSSIFTAYFAGSAAVHIPGRTFPVTTYFLDEVWEAVGRNGGGGGGSSRGGRGGGRGGNRRGGFSSKGKRSDSRENEGENDDINGKDEGDILLDMAFGGEKAMQGTKQGVTMSPSAEGQPIDYDLIVELIKFIRDDEEKKQGDCSGKKKPQEPSNQQRGAILIFLPGLAEIDRLVRMLKKDPATNRDSKIFALHSSIPTESQRQVFRRMPPGVTKIIVSTNIAETSITIDDVTVIIDAGRVKEMGYDPHTHMASLKEVWVSKASASQRAGRAGRVGPGTCWRLYPETFMRDCLCEFTLCEMRRTSLEDLVLTVLLLELGHPQEFLQKAIEHPSPRAVEAALRTLMEIEAIFYTDDGKILLKPLGYHLAHLPVDVRLGKMLVVGAIFDCLEPILTIASALSSKPPFTSPLGKREEAWQAKSRFASDKSDHLAIVEAYNAWTKVRDRHYQDRKNFCLDNFLSMSALEMMDSLREQFRDNLRELGFISTSKGATNAGDGGGKPTYYDRDDNLLRCVLCSGLYPQVVRLVRPSRGSPAHFLTRDCSQVFIHPSSVNSKRVNQASSTGRTVYALYHRRVHTTKVYIHDITFVSPFSLLLFGGNLFIDREHSSSKRTVMILDEWLAFKMREDSSVLLKYLKREMDKTLLLKIEDPTVDLVARTRPVVEALRHVLKSEYES